MQQGIKKILALSLLIFQVTLLPAQTADDYDPTTLFRQLSGAADSADKANKLRIQAIDSIDNGQVAAAERILDKALITALKYGKERLINNILNNLAECYSTTGRYEKTFQTYNELLERVKRTGDTSSISSVLINLGDEYAKVGQKEMAIKTELEAIRLKEACKNFKRLAFYYQKLGELFMTTDPEKWEYYTNKALKLSRTPENTTWYATIAIYNSLGGIWSDKHEYRKAEAYYDTMYMLSQEAEYPKGISTSVSEKALMRLNQGRYKEALPLAIEAFQYAINGDSEYKIVYSSTLLARNYLLLNQPSKAAELLEPALKKAQKARLLPEALNAMEKLSSAYAANNQWQKAFQIQSQWISLKDSVDGVEIKKVVNDLQTKYETEKKQELINRLSEQNKTQKQLTNRLQGLLTISAVALTLLVIILRLRNRSIRQNKILHQQEQQIMKLENGRLSLDLEYKSRELTAATLHLINKNEVLSDLKKTLEHDGNTPPDLNQVVRRINQNLNLDNDWSNFRRHFEEVHPDFFARLKTRFPSLTPNEERLCAYLRINLSTKEISNMLNVTTAAVDKSRNRLRKKLEIASEVNLTEFIASV